MEMEDEIFVGKTRVAKWKVRITYALDVDGWVKVG